MLDVTNTAEDFIITIPTVDKDTSCDITVDAVYGEGGNLAEHDGRDDASSSVPGIDNAKGGGECSSGQAAWSLVGAAVGQGGDGDGVGPDGVGRAGGPNGGGAGPFRGAGGGPFGGVGGGPGWDGAGGPGGVGAGGLVSGVQMAISASN